MSDIAPAVTTSAFESNNFVYMSQEPLNPMPDGTARCVKAQYGRTSAANLTRDDSLGATAVRELLVPKMIQKVGDRGTNNYSAHDYSNTIPANPMSDRGQMIVEPLRVRTATAQGYDECPAGGSFDAAYPTSDKRRGRVQENGNVTGALTAQGDMHCVYEGTQTNPQPQPEMTQTEQPRYRIRKLTPRECFRLMDVEDEHIDLIQAAEISKTQQYKMAGNSIVVSCLYHIFHNLFIDCPPSPDDSQPTLF